MQITESKNKMFANWMSSLTTAQHREAMNKLVNECGVCRQTIYAWRNNKTGIRNCYVAIINDVAGYNVFEA